MTLLVNRFLERSILIGVCCELCADTRRLHFLPLKLVFRFCWQQCAGALEVSIVEGSSFTILGQNHFPLGLELTFQLHVSLVLQTAPHPDAYGQAALHRKEEK